MRDPSNYIEPQQNYDLTTVERSVLEILAPGGLLTLDALARRTGRQVREVRRATNSLRAKNLAWANRRGQWSAAP
ncbi:hypothetical protein [Nocardia fluminea]|uniref:Uncharacterized protein n=1 Tax=Nocardia fluminea TaxID=134984 RepID=A0A2N3VCL6_9NOCA|nr:hypothetical protein [Nocardia fluminea]PKV79345.1 hypothetical protein ATK86_3737 [Nocardia fluminea]